ncbi:nickel pincer cofactor biosynthesis protein LarB [Oceanidesulfovibrio marinus]|uniref:Nickel pincer cofactor biosynthesis protein LarB n=1 Tax=Oceanidesulfovibrio marinus TaxID=370038 RepID=A0A6P1ZNR8_9BACT|nr:nickel pincer cofactor biosynthesis protein LarB [Oceanidesulfovibrio marinus]TVM36874.1 nickel pincer cofactor biosynthesis protein LarB [Oceanidesulfovibrio marinus]
MDSSNLSELLRAVAEGKTAPEDAARSILQEPFRRTIRAQSSGEGTADDPGVCLDNHRSLRTGMGEVVFGQGKSRRQMEAAVAGLGESGEPVLVTRLDDEDGTWLLERFPGGEHWPAAKLFISKSPSKVTGSLAGPFGADKASWPNHGEIVVVTAGSSDIPVALEAVGTLRFLGLEPGLVPDVGVAGIHRLEPHLPALSAARLLIVAAGMEGALASVLAGLVSAPLIAVPTSVGYGASFGGLSALLAMLNACAPGVAVVNIDNGFGAAALAARLLAI